MQAPRGAQRSYLESRARPAHGLRRAARPSAGNTPLRLRRALAAGRARPRCPPWPLARPARCALLAAAAAAAGPRNRGEITPPNDRLAPGVVAAPAGASPGRASQPIKARAGAVPANQRPPSRSQPRSAGGRAAAGRSWARKRRAAARPVPPRSAPGLGQGASLKEAPAVAPPTSGSVCRPLHWPEVVRRRTHKRAFLQHAPSSAYCAPGTRVTAPGRAREPALDGHFEQCSPIGVGFHWAG